MPVTCSCGIFTACVWLWFVLMCSALCVTAANGAVQGCGAGDQDQGLLKGRSRATSEEGPSDKGERGDQVLADRVHREAQSGGVCDVHVCVSVCVLHVVRPLDPQSVCPPPHRVTKTCVNYAADVCAYSVVWVCTVYECTYVVYACMHACACACLCTTHIAPQVMRKPQVMRSGEL